MPAMIAKDLQSSVTGTDAGRYARLWICAAGVVGFAVLTAVGANIAIPIPGTPVPLTLQTLFVLLAGITLGPRLGTASMVFYLLLGTTGYHVFALGKMGLATVFGPTGGYLLGFMLAQPLLGWLSRPRRRVWLALLAAVVAGNLVIFATGLLWLSVWLGADFGRTLQLGLWPFVPGLFLKTGMAIAAGRAVLPFRNRLFGAA